MIDWFARNHVAANLLMLSVIFLGFFSLKFSVPLEVFPSITADVVNVRMSLQGATPEDVEQGLAVRIEEAIADLEGIDKIASRSVEGSTRVTIDVTKGYEAREILDDIKSRVDGISTFPDDAGQPRISLHTRRREVITVTVSGQRSELEIRQFAEKVRDDLMRLPGINQLDLLGVREYEVAISVSQDRLRQYQLSFNDISQAIANSSVDLSAGSLKTRGGDILLRTKGQAYHQNDFEDIVVKTNADGSQLLLKDVAEVDDGFEETPLRARFNNQPAAFIDVYRIGDQSAIEVAKKVRDYIESEQSQLPEGLSLSFWDDDSRIVKSRLGTLISNALQGSVLVLLLLSLFLRPAVAFWVAIGIPISFLGAFWLMPYVGVTLNIMSLFGFILVLGIVVDDAIVTGENVYSHLQRAENGLHAAIVGTREVALPVTFGVLTTVVAFLPMAFIEGRRGALFGQIPAVVIPVLMFSLIESKFVLPAHLKYLDVRSNGKKKAWWARWQQRFADGFERFIELRFQPFLKACMNYRYTTLATFFGVLVLSLSFVSSGWMRFTFFPRIPSESVRVYLNMPAGTPFDITDQQIQRFVDAAETLQKKYVDPQSGDSVILNILANTGSAGGSSETGNVRFELASPEVRTIDVSSTALAREWRKLVGEIPGAESVTYRAEIGGWSQAPIRVQLSAKSYDTLLEVSEKAKAYLATVPQVFAITDNLSDGKQELRLSLTPQGQSVGLKRGDVIRQVREAVYGVEVQRVQRGRDEVKVMLRLPASERATVANLRNLLIRTPAGQLMPLAHVAHLEAARSPTTVHRVDRFRTGTVEADVNKEVADLPQIQSSLRAYMTELTNQYPGVDFSMEGEAKEQAESFSSLQVGLLFVLFVVYSLLAIPFRSYAQPIIVMLVIPFGIIGAIAGHAIMGMDLTIMSYLGMLALVGVVVNDSLVLVDAVNRRLREGQGEMLPMVVKATCSRFRPVFLTSVTTFFGLMPLLFETATQAQFLIPMAVSLGFGILFATFITLIMVPANYLVLEDIKRLFGLQPTTASNEVT